MSRMVIFVGGAELINWTAAELTRKKKDLTGSLTVNIFFDYVPDSPVLINSYRGQEVLVYIDEHLAFTGVIDKRKGNNRRKVTTDVKDGELKANVSERGYSITLTARGKTKYLVNCSHQHPTGNIRNSNNRNIAEEIIKDYNIELDWNAKEIDISNHVLLDGGRAVDELHRLCNENCHFIYETRNGKLRITDEPLEEYGIPIILGENIIEFNAEQSENDAHSKIRIRGHRNSDDTWGEEAILEREQVVEDKHVQSFSPITLEHSGDGTDESLARRAKWEADSRTAQCKRVQVSLFDIAAQDGMPFDIGLLHYVEIPPEGIYDVLECIELSYSVSRDKVNTTLVLAPPPSKIVSGRSLYPGISGNALLEPVSAINEMISLASSKKASSGITYANNSYPQNWGSAELSVVKDPLVNVVQEAVNFLLDPDADNKNKTPPLRLRR